MMSASRRERTWPGGLKEWTMSDGVRGKSWLEMLDEMEASVAASLAATPELQPAEEPNETHLDLTEPLAQLEDRLEAMQASVNRAEAAAAEVDLLLRADSEALAEWKKAHAAAQESLQRVIPEKPSA
jgi:hypothetical protein